MVLDGGALPAHTRFIFLPKEKINRTKKEHTTTTQHLLTLTPTAFTTGAHHLALQALLVVHLAVLVVLACCLH